MTDVSELPGLFLQNPPVQLSQNPDFTHLSGSLCYSHKLKTRGLEVAMTGSRDISGQSCLGAGVQEEAQLGRRWHPCVGGRGGAAVIHGVLTWARTGRWRMRQAEPAGKGILWAGGYYGNFLGSWWRSASICISRTGRGLWEHST